MNDDTWGRPPRRKARPGTKWLGRWERRTVHFVGEGGKVRRQRAWVREYLELDGHEECCRHVWPVYVFVDDRHR